MSHKNRPCGYNGLTYDDMLNGHSKLRNRTIANVFSQMGLVESWGTGIRKIIDSAKEYDLPQPEFIEMPETFRVNFFRKPLQPADQQVGGEDFGDDGKMIDEKGTEKAQKRAQKHKKSWNSSSRIQVQQ